MSNPFEDLAQAQMVRATKRMHERAEKKLAKFTSLSQAPMVPTGLEKKQQESSRQFRLYRRAKRAEYRAQLDGPYRNQWRALSRVLRRLTLNNSSVLIEHVHNAEWLRQAGREERYIALSIIAHAIARLRIRNGYEPFDDSIPGEEPTAYELIYDMLRG